MRPRLHGLLLVKAALLALVCHDCWRWPRTGRCGVQGQGSEHGPSAAGEEWLGGPYVTMRCLRKLITALDQIQVSESRSLAGAIRVAADGRTEALVMPGKRTITRSRRALRVGCGWKRAGTIARCATRKRSSTASVIPSVACRLSSGGNVASIPPTDALYKMFHEGMLCIVKLNPVNEYLGPFYEQAFQPLIERGYLRFGLWRCRGGKLPVVSPADRRCSHHRVGSYARSDRLGSAG